MLRHASTVLLIILASFGGLTEVVYSWAGFSAGSGAGAESVIGMLTVLVTFAAMVGLSVLIARRRRAPFLLTIAGAIVGLVLPIGPVFAMIGLPELIARERGKRTAIGVAATFAVIVTSTLTDLLTSNREASFLQSLSFEQPDGSLEYVVATPALAIVVILFSMSTPVGVGVIMRYRSKEHQARQRGDELGGELARSQERERIAHEIHDVLGHRLSLISLQAGALEAKSSAHPELREATEQLRVNAARSMDDLRSLLRVIQGEAQQVSLTDLNDLISAQVVDGQDLALTVYLQDAERASAELSRGVVRIVQEVITNARKHAPGAQLRLSVAGGPAVGVTISAANPLSYGNVGGAGAGAGAGTGRGLSGMQERVRLLGGQFQAGTYGQEFRVHVTLPWTTDR